MDRDRLEYILSNFANLHIAVIGDFFLDRYFIIDPNLAEVSVETGLTVHQVTSKRLSPGAAGTVVSNLCALGVGKVSCVGVIGVDGEGFELKNGLEKLGADYSLLIEREDRVTPCYTKPMLVESSGEREIERIDIKNRSVLPAAAESELIGKFESLIEDVDAVIIGDQVQERNYGVVTDNIRGYLAETAMKYPDKVFLADSRLRIGEFKNVITKPNKFEVLNAIKGGVRVDTGDIPDFTIEDAIECAKALFSQTNKPVFMTAQEEGIFIVAKNIVRVPAVIVEGEIDPVGAGDSCAAGITSAICAGASLEEAALIGNVVASITIRKIGQTGTASPTEIIEKFNQQFAS